MIHPPQQSPQKRNLMQSNSDQLSQNSPKNFPSSLVIPTLNKGRSRTGHICKHLSCMRDGPGERELGRNLKWLVLRPETQYHNQ
ncbi:unnamed protein product [Hymenolepis diminuta]|uniref:Uncharacterized protein n=1 Tax=Hymenolepis diminuta TaxID=6216 RepID=A0A564YW02_HYMDI|nr:unnamed protein product [Hymenolepis diminuta]